VNKRQGPAVISFVSELTIVMVSIYLPYRAFELGADAWLVGLVGASGSVAYVFAPYLTGKLSDRFGPRRLLMLGSASIAALCLLYTAVSNPAVFVPLRLIEGVAWAMIWPPLEALFSVSGSDLGRSMKVFNLAWGAGAITAPIFGSLVVDLSSVEWTLLASAAFMATALAVSLGIKTTPAAHAPRNRELKGGLDGKRYVTLLSNMFVYGLTLTTISTFFPKYAASLHYEVALWGASLSAIYAGRLLAFLLSERIMTSVGTKKARPAFLAVSLCFPLCSMLPRAGVYLVLAAALVTGLGFGLVYSSTLVDMLSGSGGARGRAAGLFESSIGLGSLVGPAVAGALASSGLWLTMALPVCAIIPVLVGGFAARVPLSAPESNDFQGR
jgi:MFS family permease